MIKKSHDKNVYLTAGFLSLFLLAGIFSGNYDQFGILKGEHFLTKSLYYKGGFRGGVRLVQSLPDKKIAICGQMGGIILDSKTRALKTSVKFQIQRGVLNPEIVDFKKDGAFKIMLRGGGFGDVGLLDHNGNVIWIYKPDNPIRPNKKELLSEMNAGDLDRNGELEFYVATIHNGIHKLDYNGKKIWEIGVGKLGEAEGRLRGDVEVYNPAEKETPLIVVRCYNGRIQFRNCDGQLVREIKPEIKIGRLQLINWPSPGHILTKSGNSIYVLDFNGKTIFKYTPIYGFNRFYGIAVKLSDEQNPYLVVITASKSRTFRQLLSIFSPDGELVYQEVLKGSPALCAIKSDSLKSEYLLVGEGCDKVWEYRLNTK